MAAKAFFVCVWQGGEGVMYQYWTFWGEGSLGYEMAWNSLWDQAGLQHTDVHLSCLQVPGLEASVVMPGYLFQYTGKKERDRF